MAAPFRTAPLIRFADTVGDGSGSIDATGDYSVTPATLKIVPPSNMIFVCQRFSIIIADAKAMDSGGYGSNGANPLTNGCSFQLVRNGEVAIDFTNGENIKTNGEWAMYMDTIDLYDFGSGDVYFVGHFDEAALQWPRYLDGRAGDEFHFTVQDDLSHLTKHRVLWMGLMIPVEQFNPDKFFTN